MSADQEINPHGSAGATPFQLVPEAPRRLSLAIAWAVVVSIVGGVACGWLIGALGEIGSVGLWFLGFLAGTVSRKLTVAPSRVAACCQVAACMLAMVLAEVCWIHWNTRQGQGGWWVSVTFLPTLVKEYTVAAFLAAIFTAFGCFSAYGIADRRYRLVRQYLD
ncbi:MAG TPA: hypothetical protein VMV69_24135 [Pirellulales bacterium]|nr:hypothetical protein [Pirellulales bacterium]